MNLKSSIVIVHPENMDVEVVTDPEWINNKTIQNDLQLSLLHDFIDKNFEYGWCGIPTEIHLNYDRVVDDIVNSHPNVTTVCAFERDKQIYYGFEFSLYDLEAAVIKKGLNFIELYGEYDEFFNRFLLRGDSVSELKHNVSSLAKSPRVFYRGPDDIVDFLRGSIRNKYKVVLLDTNQELIDYFKKYPEKTREMDPFDFEKLVATILKNNGFDVELTPQSRDRGFDILAVKKDPVLGTTPVLVECKRYAKTNKVGIGIVQRLLGTMDNFRTENGIIVTTSAFTREAKWASESATKPLQLRDYDNLSSWLKQIM